VDDWRDYGELGLPPVLAGALAAFFEQGYHGTSMREIATRAGLSVAGVYHHHASKQEILAALVGAVMDDLIARCHAALASVPDHPEQRFDAVVECLLRFHMHRREAAFVASTELRSLATDHRSRYVAQRDEVQGLVHEQLIRWVDGGGLDSPYPVEAARAVASLCVGVATWFREDGELSADELVTRYLVLTRSLVGSGSP
jgi:AcrR family transcriptional regulator